MPPNQKAGIQSILTIAYFVEKLTCPVAFVTLNRYFFQGVWMDAYRFVWRISCLRHFAKHRKRIKRFVFLNVPHKFCIA